MACVLVPAAEAIVVTVVTKVVMSREKKAAQTGAGVLQSDAHQATLPFSRKLKWLNAMLWGGALLLAFEHVWHGEIVPWFPFLTAGSGEILREMATVGVGMAVLVTAVWCVMVLVPNAAEKKSRARASAEGSV